MEILITIVTTVAVIFFVFWLLGLYCRDALACVCEHEDRTRYERFLRTQPLLEAEIQEKLKEWDEAA